MAVQPIPGKPIPGKVPNKPQKNITLYIDDVRNDCEAYSKDIPQTAQLPAYWNNDPNLPITWFNNFGVRYTSGPNKGKNIPNGEFTYKVRLKIPDDPNNQERTICIYDESKPQGQRLEIKGSGGNGNIITFDLNLGDPPTGIFP